jgi:hypothetical protein
VKPNLIAAIMLNKKVKPFFKIEKIITPPAKSPVKAHTEPIPKKVKKQPQSSSTEQKKEIYSA